MPGKRLLWHLFPTFLIVTLIALLGVVGYAIAALRGFYFTQVRSALESRAHLLEHPMADLLAEGRSQQIDRLCKELGPEAGVRITVVLPDGEVMGDSEEDPGDMENHADRPEIKVAYGGEVGSARRHSATLEEPMMYVAVPVRQRGELVGVVRVSVPLTTLQEALWSFHVRVGLAVIFVFLLVAVVSLVVSRRLARPLEEMKEGAERFAEGKLDQKLRVSGASEVNALAQSLNEMAEEIKEKIRVLERRNNEQRAVLASMVEGVIAVDAGGNVLTLNRTAGRLLGVDPQNSRGRSIEEAVRNSRIQAFVRRALGAEEGEPIEENITLEGERETLLQARGTALRDAEGRRIGALVVLNDVTRLRQLERVRRDFVANVSHELKTPITAIKGFVETLQDRGLEDPDQALHFLGIVSDQADRLNAIIRDLMSLARIEQGDEEKRIDTERTRIGEVLKAAVRDCQAQAEHKGMEIQVECPPHLHAYVNPPLMEQAVANLVDNAIKYSPENNTVWVKAEQDDGRVAIHVRDRGCGISREHLPRLFERFYRTDKARSRKLGGTGLGLSIVKHVARAHGGSVNAESTVGEGSVFSIYVPTRQQG
jgi:two-component system phosphate regulon sensor histidine kinase PhoR